jgi:hypothetical protein
VVGGDKAGPNAAGVGPNQGLGLLMQQAVINQNGTNAVSVTTYVPKHSVLVDILVDTLTAFNSATSATLSVGNVAAGTQYAGGLDVKTAAGRQRPTFTAAQLSAMADAGEPIVATLTPVGATSAGQVVVTYVYAQTANWQNP